MRFLRATGEALLSLCKERRYEEELDDDAFYRLYYGNTTIPKDIPIRVRKVCVEQMGRRWLRVKPEDWLIENDDLDFFDLMDEIGDEFDITIPNEDIQRLDASFDSVVRHLAGRINQSGGTPP
jgi:acyl carrier protein